MSLLTTILARAPGRLGKLRQLHTTNVLTTFWERDEKGGYKDTRPQPSKRELIREGWQELKQEISLWSQEVKEHFESDPVLVYRPGETDVVWKFDAKIVKEWVVTCDSDNNEGFSRGVFRTHRDGHAVFEGELSTRVPKDGRVKRSGYCNIKSLRARKSFKREGFFDWNCYNMLVLKVRGDGRSYMLNVATKGYFDIMWNDVYHFALFTRGGPYWQVVKIPFSKFFLSSKGRVQDRQYPIPLSKVTSFGISMADKIEGPFQLEIDYVGVEFDPNHTEEFAYEMYKTDKYIVAT